MHDYLIKIPNWALYLAIARKNMVYDMKSDNIVEGIFSWIRDERSLMTPLYFINGFMLKYATRISDLISNSGKIESELTPRAIELFNKSRQRVYSSEIAYKVVSFNENLLQACILKQNDIQVVSLCFTVDLRNKI